MATGPAAVMLLLSPGEWSRRRDSLVGDLKRLEEGIAADLAPVLGRPLYIPREKAALSRVGGRCEHDGSLLDFDPFDEQHHRCPLCARVHDGNDHRGFWRYWYHLWLAERAVHAAVLFRLRGDERHERFAAAVLDGYADQYLHYPNADNALGPSRVFFSTYLESIWLLQLCIALDALEGADAARSSPLGARVRERILEPSSSLIAQFDEAMSNRQVWNVVARLAAARMLDRDELVAELLEGRSGLTALLMDGCLSDGMWYEGENYHMFAHRGLWYGVAMAEAAGALLGQATIARFEAGFAAPFLTALPDMTLPSRRDSQYAISLRQPRFAEACELGLARHDDRRLRTVLAELYCPPHDVPARDPGRSRTSADVERNLPSMRLQRSDLGWRALLFARETLPALERAPLRSVLLEGQGIAVLRRDADQVYLALDYGSTGGGHGHPDRLNVLLMSGSSRWLDDMGTGSYVDRTLHWYRSSLAHNAPLVDGRSQLRVPGRLVAYDERGEVGWVHAAVEGVAPGVRIERMLVAMRDYLIDEIWWTADHEVTVDVPNHAPIEVVGNDAWHSGTLRGGSGLEDGFDFLSKSETRAVAAGEVIALRAAAAQERMRVFASADQSCEWWRAVAPAAPGKGEHVFHVVRTRAMNGRLRTVWTWSAEVAGVDFGAATCVARHDGTQELHKKKPAGWRVELVTPSSRSIVELGGLRSLEANSPASEGARAGEKPQAPPADDPLSPRRLPFTVHLGAAQYRRSEQTWEEAGRTAATVTVRQEGQHVEVHAQIRKTSELVFIRAGQENPLDNEPAEINGDGMQVYLRAGEMAGAWTVVPVPGSTRARGVPVAGWEGLELGEATWGTLHDGYELRVSLRLPTGFTGSVVHIGILVNEAHPGRARRTGQLGLSEAAGEWVYLRGDRYDRERLLPVSIATGDVGHPGG